jgi:hypothetical protein
VRTSGGSGLDDSESPPAIRLVKKSSRRRSIPGARDSRRVDTRPAKPTGAQRRADDAGYARDTRLRTSISPLGLSYVADIPAAFTSSASPSFYDRRSDQKRRLARRFADTMCHEAKFVYRVTPRGAHYCSDQLAIPQ